MPVFTGIIDTVGTVISVQLKRNTLFLQISADGFTHDLKPGSSVAADGVCLTVTRLTENSFYTEAVQETLSKTTLKRYKTGRRVNLEKAVMLGSRLDGHLVQGHIDGSGTLVRRRASSGNVLLTFRLQPELISGVVNKGSIAIDGISLTVANMSGTDVTVTVVPFTLEHTTLNEKRTGEMVNIETDIIGKYIARFARFHNVNNRTAMY